MGWIGRLTGADRLRNAGRSRMKAAQIQLNGPDYNQVTGNARDSWSAIGDSWNKQLGADRADTYGRIGGTFGAARQQMGDIYGSAQGRLDDQLGAQLKDVRRGGMLNARALANYGGQALGSLSSNGGSLQARFAGAQEMQSQMGQQMLQNQGQQYEAMGQARGNYMGLSTGLSSDQAGQMGNLASQEAGIYGQLGQAFGQMGLQSNMQAGELGFQQGQADYGNQMQEAIMQRQIAQEPYLADAQYQQGRAQQTMGMLQMGIGLAGAIPGLGSALGAVGSGLMRGAGGLLNAGQAAGGGIGGFLGSFMPGGQSPFGGAGGNSGWGTMMQGFSNTGMPLNQAFQSIGQGFGNGWNQLSNGLAGNQAQTQSNQDWYNSLTQSLQMGGGGGQQGGGNQWAGFGSPQNAYQYGLSGGQAGPVGGGGYGYQGFGIRPPWVQ